MCLADLRDLHTHPRRIESKSTRLPPNPHRGPGLNLSRPTRPAARLRPSTSHASSPPRLSLPSHAPQRAQPRPLSWRICISPSSYKSGHVCLACAGRPRTAPTPISCYPNHRSSCLFTHPSRRQALMTSWPPLPSLSRLLSCGNLIRAKALR